MAVIQTPKGRIIGLIVEDSQPKLKAEPAVVTEEKAAVSEEPPKRGRPRKQ